MSVQIQCCALAIMLVLVYFYKSQKQVNLRTERAYWKMFCMTFISIAFDMISCFVIRNMDILPLAFVKIICKLYLVSLACMSAYIMMYVGADIFPVKEKYHKMLMRHFVFITISTILILALPINIFFDPATDQLYTYGPSDIVTYAVAGITLFVVMVSVFMSWNKMTKGRRDGVLIGMSIILCAALIQMFNSKLLIVGFAGALCMVVLYLKLENPGYNLDTQTGLFNQNAFNLYTSQFYSNALPFSVIEIGYDSGAAHNSASGGTIANEFTEVVNFISSVPNILAFRSLGNEIFIFIKDPEKAPAILERLRERFDEGWGRSGDVMLTPYWIFVPDSRIVENPGALIETLAYVRQNSTELAESRFTVLDEDLIREINDEKEIAKLILGALVNDRVEVFYQPIYSTKEHKFTAAEALVRIRDGEGNIVPPGKFINVAESNGMIMSLGEVVFKKVCQFIRDNDIEKLGLQYIEINLSVVQCGDTHLADKFIGIMQQYGIRPDMINLEITESASVSTKNVLLQNMQKLIDFGVNFSLDDFGTGQSNLNYIIDMPVGIVKFDREMTNAYFANGKAKFVMDAAMKMIHGLDLDIVSEGVENESQFRTMVGLNISYIQGFYFSRPLPQREFISFLTEHNL